MRINSVKYLTKQGVTSVWKNGMMTLASVGILTACLLIVGCAVLLTENTNAMIGYVESQNEMVAFMEKPSEQGFVLVDDTEQKDEETTSNVENKDDKDEDKDTSSTSSEDTSSDEASSKTDDDTSSEDDKDEDKDTSSTSSEDNSSDETSSKTDDDTSSEDDKDEDKETSNTSSEDTSSDSTSSETTSKVENEDDTTTSAVEDSEDNENSEEEVKLEEKSITEWKAYISSIQASIAKINGVIEVDYVSSEQGLSDIEQGMMGDKGYLLENYKGEENPIRESFVIKLKDLSLVGDVSSKISAISGIKQVNAADNVASTITDIRHIVNIVALSIIFALTIVSLVIIVNTIRASIHSRSKEISIMKYVGATNTFIKVPFVVEGVCLGIISAGLAYLLIWGGYNYLTHLSVNNESTWINSLFETIIPFKDVSIKLGIYFLISSISIGVIGSLCSIRNHIKV